MLGPETLSGETALLAALRCGDEDAFSALVDAYGAAMHRVALTFVRSSAVADEVVQEAWLGALRGLDRFEGRSALKTWLLRIVANIARTHAVREARTVPFSSLELAREVGSEHEPALPADRFQGPDGRHPGRWVSSIHQIRTRSECSLRGWGGYPLFDHHYFRSSLGAPVQ